MGRWPLKWVVLHNIFGCALRLDVLYMPLCRIYTACILNPLLESGLLFMFGFWVYIYVYERGCLYIFIAILLL